MTVDNKKKNDFHFPNNDIMHIELTRAAQDNISISNHNLPNIYYNSFYIWFCFEGLTAGLIDQSGIRHHHHHHLLGLPRYEDDDDYGDDDDDNNEGGDNDGDDDDNGDDDDDDDDDDYGDDGGDGDDDDGGDGDGDDDDDERDNQNPINEL